MASAAVVGNQSSVISIRPLINRFTWPKSSSATAENKFFGGIWQGTPKESFKRYFNQVTPENVGKWGTVNWGSLDAMFDYAEKNDFLTKQHTFVWGSHRRPKAAT